jgi:hypothetical protein
MDYVVTPSEDWSLASEGKPITFGFDHLPGTREVSDLLQSAIKRAGASNVRVTYQGGVTGWLTVIVWETWGGRSTEEIHWNLFRGSPTITPTPVLLPSDQYFDLVCDTDPESRVFGGVPEDDSVRSEIVSLLSGDRGLLSYTVRYDRERRGWVARSAPWPPEDGAGPVETFWYLRRHVLPEVVEPMRILDETTRFPTSRYILRMGRAEVIGEFDQLPLDSDVRQAIRRVLHENDVDVSITGGAGVWNTWDVVMTGPDWDGSVTCGLYEVGPDGGHVLVGPAMTRFILRSDDPELGGFRTRTFNAHPTDGEIRDALWGLLSIDRASTTTAAGSPVFRDAPRLAVTYVGTGELLVRMVPQGEDVVRGAVEIQTRWVLGREDTGQLVGPRVE